MNTNILAERSAKACVESGDIVAGIKIYMLLTDARLSEAVQDIKRFSNPYNKHVMAAYREEGLKIPAIIVYRDFFPDSSLLEAKNAVEKMISRDKYRV